MIVGGIGRVEVDDWVVWLARGLGVLRRCLGVLWLLMMI
jgi:hypothetical protein